MIRDDAWPPTKAWTQVFVSWDSMLTNGTTRPLLDWVKKHRGYGKYQLRGPDLDPTSGFLFYFEDARDATMFKLKWCQ